MNKKGFTLIELLVVIVILAIIALITVPNALAMITTAQTRANERSAEGIKRAAEVYCLREKTGNNATFTPNTGTAPVAYTTLSGAGLVKVDASPVLTTVTVNLASCTAQ